jgi:antitoxin PrlF
MSMVMIGRVAEGGRIVIPAEYRRALGIAVGDEVILELADGEIHVFTRQHAIERAQALMRQYIPEGRNLVDELIAERHAEAERE